MQYQTIFERRFLLKKLPENFNRTDEHLQVFEHFIENTRLCLRTIRVPGKNEYTYILEQKFPVNEGDFSVLNLSQIYLNKAESEIFSQFRNNEIRFNRYFLNYQNKQVEIDIFLGKDKQGQMLGTIKFETFAEMQDFEIPVFADSEVFSAVV